MYWLLNIKICNIFKGSHKFKTSCFLQAILVASASKEVEKMFQIKVIANLIVNHFLFKSHRVGVVFNNTTNNP